MTPDRGGVTLGSVSSHDDASVPSTDPGGHEAGRGDASGRADAAPPPGMDVALGTEMLTKPPFVPVAPEVFLAAGMSSQAEAEDESARWLEAMASGLGELGWTDGGPGTVVGRAASRVALCRLLRCPRA